MDIMPPEPSLVSHGGKNKMGARTRKMAAMLTTQYWVQKWCMLTGLRNIRNFLTALTFTCPCITSISLKYNQQDATFSLSIYFYKLLYMFQAVPSPNIRSTKLYIQRQVLSNQFCCLLLSWMRWNVVPDAVCAVLCS